MNAQRGRRIDSLCHWNPLKELKGGVLLINNRLNNSGQLVLAGGTTRVNGPTDNAADGQMEISNVAVFSADVVNHGSVKLTNAAVTFVGTYTEHGSFTSDTSDIHYLGDLVVQDSGHLASGAGDVFHIAGNLQNHSLQATLWDTGAATLRFEGTGLHEFSLPGADLGSSAAGYSANLAWDALSLEGDSLLSLIDGNAQPSAALYVDEFLLLHGIGQVADIQSAFNIYYAPRLAGNTYLGGMSYSLSGGGSLMAAAVPKPETYAMLLAGLGWAGLGWACSRCCAAGVGSERSSRAGGTNFGTRWMPLHRVVPGDRGQADIVATGFVRAPAVHTSSSQTLGEGGGQPRRWQSIHSEVGN